MKHLLNKLNKISFESKIKINKQIIKNPKFFNNKMKRNPQSIQKEKIRLEKKNL